MEAAADLLEIHRRTHASLRKLLEHCAGFSAEELRRDLAGFGYGNLLAQLHHLMGAEQYWIGVLQGLLLVDEDPADGASIEALSGFRNRVAEGTREHLRNQSDTDLRTPRTVTLWGGRQAEVVPMHVVLRTQTHIFQHQGQVAAMCRLLGRPIPAGLDYPLVE